MFIYSLGDILSELTCPYVQLKHEFRFLGKRGKEVCDIYPSFKNLAVGMNVFSNNLHSVQGTIGFFVRSVLDRESVFFVTNAHVANFEHCIDETTRKYIYYNAPQVLPVSAMFHPSHSSIVTKR